MIQSLVYQSCVYPGMGLETNYNHTLIHFGTCAQMCPQKRKGEDDGEGKETEPKQKQDRERMDLRS